MSFGKTNNNTSIFQPRPGDKCQWLDEQEFFDLDDQLEERDVSIEELHRAYSIMKTALDEAGLPSAAIGGYAFTVLGARPLDSLTHDVDFIVHCTPRELFVKFRTMENVRLRRGLQADNFRVHCQISEGIWIGVDILQTVSTPQTSVVDGVEMLNIMGLLKTKLSSFAGRQSPRDAGDILYLVDHHKTSIDAMALNQANVQTLLESLPSTQRMKAQRALLSFLV